jgi:hypothetical protein
MTVSKPVMTEGASRFYTALFSALTVVGVLAGGAYTIIQYFQTRAKDAETFNLQAAAAQLEAKKPFYEKHLDLCTEASTAASTIANIRDPQKLQKALDDFWLLWDGPLAIVEGDKVASSMIDFGNCLKSKCGNLQSLSIALSHSCRDEISDHFDLHLPAVPQRRVVRPDDD